MIIREGIAMEDTSSIRAILFDSDNTIYDYKKAHMAGCDAVIKYIGNGDSEALDSYFLMNPFDWTNEIIIKNYLNDIGINEDETLRNACDRYEKNRCKNTVLFDGVYETLSSLRERKILLGIVTNAQYKNVFSFLELTNIKDFFHCIVTPEEAHSKKPATGPFKHALSILSVKPMNLMMVGDNIGNDLIPAKRIGLKTILFKNGKSNDGFIFPIQDVDYIINNFHCILDIIDEL